MTNHRVAAVSWEPRHYFILFLLLLLSWDLNQSCVVVFCLLLAWTSTLNLGPHPNVHSSSSLKIHRKIKPISKRNFRIYAVAALFPSDVDSSPRFEPVCHFHGKSLRGRTEGQPETISLACGVNAYRHFANCILACSKILQIVNLTTLMHFAVYMCNCICVEYYLFLLQLKAVFLNLVYLQTSTFESTDSSSSTDDKMYKNYEYCIRTS